MFNSAFFVRILVAVVGAIVAILLIPALFRLVGFPTSTDLMLVVKLVIAICAVYYVIEGS